MGQNAEKCSTLVGKPKLLPNNDQRGKRERGKRERESDKRERQKREKIKIEIREKRQERK